MHSKRMCVKSNSTQSVNTCKSPRSHHLGDFHTVKTQLPMPVCLLIHSSVWGSVIKGKLHRMGLFGSGSKKKKKIIDPFFWSLEISHSFKIWLWTPQSEQLRLNLIPLHETKKKKNISKEKSVKAASFKQIRGFFVPWKGTVCKICHSGGHPMKTKTKDVVWWRRTVAWDGGS